MPRYLVKGSYGFAGTDFEDEFEAENEEQLNEIVFHYMAERLSWEHTLIEGEEEEDESQR